LLQTVRQQNLFVAGRENCFGPTRGRSACTSFAQSMLKIIAEPRNKNCSRRNPRQKLIAKSDDMTGFDEWMCMPAIGTRLARS
jgi:hypothetical protein